MGRNRSPVLDRIIRAVRIRRVLLGGQYIDEEIDRPPVWAARLDRNVTNELISGQVAGVARYLASDQSIYLVRAYDAVHFTIGGSAIDENGQLGRVIGKEPMGRIRYTQIIWERA